MAERQSFLLRADPALLDAIRHWADDELRSMNGHIEFLLRQALKQAGRLPKKSDSTPSDQQEPTS